MALRGVRSRSRSAPSGRAGRGCSTSARACAPRGSPASEIPAFVDEPADSFDQIIENEQREALRRSSWRFLCSTARGGRARPRLRGAWARARLTLLCLRPDRSSRLADGAYRDGRCRGVKELYDLRRLHDEHPEEVARLLLERTCVSRGAVADLRGRLAPDANAAARPLTVSGPSDQAHVCEPPVGAGSSSASEVSIDGLSLGRDGNGPCVRRWTVAL